MVKFLGDNPATTNMRDKNFLIMQEGGKDYIGSWAVLLDNLKTDLIRPILKVQIGKIIINMDNSKRDVEVWNDGIFEYQICTGRAINAESCPELAAIYGANTPNFQNATVRHIPEGDSRTLGSYQADDIKAHTHPMGHQHNVKLNYVNIGYGGGAIHHDVYCVESTSQSKSIATTGGIDNTGSIGGSETRMQNIAVQFYVISKVMI